MKLNEGRLLGSKATAGVEGELKLNPPAGADVDDCNIIIKNINLLEKKNIDFGNKYCTEIICIFNILNMYE